MGMYDNVRCEAPLPDGYKAKANIFQTKDLDCTMATHVITADGRLLLGSPWWEDGNNVDPPRESDFHGWLNFYDYVVATHEWHEYRAKFTDGRLVKIEVVPDARPTPSAQESGR